MPWKFGAAQNIGGRKEQQDRLTIISLQEEDRHLVAVADGMGGLRDGAQAAQIVIDVAAENFSKYAIHDPYKFLYDICQAAHQKINDLQYGLEAAPGTTAVLLYIHKQHAHWAHIGDTRLYHIRNGRLLSQTNDHSLFQLMTAKGLIEPHSDAAKSMQSQLYMRLGGEHLPEPEFASAEVRDGDLFIICSDGFWQAVPPDQVVAALDSHPLYEDGPEYLVQLARQRGGNHCDNITLALLQWSDSSLKGFCKRLAMKFL